MSKKNLLSTCSDFEKLTKASLIDLKEMVDRYPYCQVGQMLFLLNLKKIADPNFETQLSYTALAVPDRPLLKQHIATIDDLTSKPQIKPLKNQQRGEILKQKGKVETKPIEKEAQWDRFAHLGTLTISNLLFDVVEEDDIQQKKGTLVKQQEGNTYLPQKSLDARPQKSKAVEDVKARLKEIGSGAVHSSDLETPKTPQIPPKVKSSVSSKVNKVKAPAKTLEKKQKTATKAKVKNHELSKEELIERFLTKPDHILITPNSKKDYSYDADINQSLKEDFENGSETLARLYITQGAIDKAIEIYKHLSLKYPEKSRFFAKEIREAKKKIIK